MPVLAIPDILALAANAGFSGSDLATAVAVALAESNPPGNTQSINPNEPHGTSYGLWQIYGYAHPQYDPAQLLNDPQYNADAAYAIYSQAGDSFLPWSTFGSGKYQLFLPQVLAAIGTGDSTQLDASVNGGSSSPAWLTALKVGAGLLAFIYWMRG